MLPDFSYSLYRTGIILATQPHDSFLYVGVSPPHLWMTPSDCRSFTISSTTAGGCFSIAAICPTLLFPSTKAKICLCFRGQERITLCSACMIRCGGLTWLAAGKRPMGCVIRCGGELYCVGGGRSASWETCCRGATVLARGKRPAGT